MSVRAVVDRTLCSSVAMCLQMAPESFVLDPDGISVLVAGDHHDPEALADAVEACPMSAISLVRESE